MDKVSRVDRAIGVGLVTVLVVLLGLGIAHTSGAARPSAPVAAPSTPASVAGTGPLTAPLADASATAGTPSTPANPVTSSPPTSATLAPTSGPVSAVGDSLMLDIHPDLQSDIPGVKVDGMVSRQFATGVGVVEADRAAGTLGNVLVVELGANGTVTAADFDAMMQAASGVSRVVFVNVDVPRPWAAGDNTVLAQGVARYPGVAILADWYTLASGHPEWFTADQVHLQPDGAQAMANLIAAVT